MEENIQKFTISAYTENNVGILNRISAIFLKRNINIETLNASKSEIEGVHRFTFVIYLSEEAVKKIVAQINKQVEVIQAYYHTEDEIIYQETALFKISSEYIYDEQLQENLKMRRANIVSLTKSFTVIEASGFKEDIDKMYEKLKPYGLLQFVRSGQISISRPRMEISQLLEDIKYK